MTTFDERERAFENLFAYDEALRFKAMARRNKAIAAWAAAQMGRNGDGAAAYGAEIVTLGLGQGGDEALVARIVADLSGAGITVSPAAVRAEMTRSLAEAVAREKSA